MGTTLKTCGLCGLPLQHKHFTPDSRTTDGLSTYCTDCQYLLSDNDEVMNSMQPHLAGTVHCRKCGTFKPRDQFSPNKRTRSGLYIWCKECWRTYYNNRRYRQSNRANIEESIRAHLRLVYGEDATPLSTIRGGNTDVAEKLYSWFPRVDPARLQKIFYEMCTVEAQPK